MSGLIASVHLRAGGGRDGAGGGQGWGRGGAVMLQMRVSDGGHLIIENVGP